MLIAHVKGRDRTWVLAHPENWIEQGEEQTLRDLLVSRLSGEPLPYLLGEWEFFGRKFRVTKDVLIPRPETEILVENALDWLRGHPACDLAADIGTGSGVIAISLAAEVPDLEIVAVDSSPQALELSSENAQRFEVFPRIHFMMGDLFSGVSDRFPLICANLPYIPTSILDQSANLSKEPRTALDGGTDGTQIIQRFLKQVPDRLIFPGLVLLEMEYEQSEMLMKFSRNLFPINTLSIINDLAGSPRILRIEVSK